jgi:hypothetical protein
MLKEQFAELLIWYIEVYRYVGIEIVYRLIKFIV